MQPSFSPSVNLVRDAEQDIHYIPTLNAKRIYNQILSDFKVGIHSFNIVGSYGTGKSSFLLALMRTLKGYQPYFGALNGQFKGANRFEFMPFVGVYGSVVEAFALYFGVSTEKEILRELDKLYKKLDKKEACLVIVIDEFGKFLEFAARNNPEKELYFVQQLAEYVNDPEKNILFLTTLHQGFFSYADGLSQTQQEEWEKVKGRLKDLTFNEPVEQLLELAASHLEVTAQIPDDSSVSQENLQMLVNVIEESAVFPYRGKLSLDFAKRLLPLDLVSAAVITEALQRYGQNERSLFTFLNATDHLGINQYDQDKHPLYNLVSIYDYLIYNFYTYLSSVRNADYVQWRAIRTAIERTEAVLRGNVADAVAIVKTIGLLNVFSPAGARINRHFLITYIEQALGLDTTEATLNELERLQILRFTSYSESFVLFDGTDINIELEVLKAADRIDAIQNVIPYLHRYFDFPLMLAKAATYKYGTPRFFEFRLSTEPLDEEPEGIADGFVNLIFSEHLTVEELVDFSTGNYPTTLFCLFTQSREISSILFEIEKINNVLDVHKDDRVAKRELEFLKVDNIRALNRTILDSLYTNDGLAEWVWQGQKIEVDNVSAFNMLLSRICEEAYSDTPVFRNELINRHKLSSAINSARSSFFSALTSKWQEADIGYVDGKFPPDRTIYLTLLHETGIHREVDGEYILTEPTDPSFQSLWTVGMDFLIRAKQTPQSVADLKDVILARPFKLKDGFVDFWLPIFLFVNRERFALYHDNIFVSSLDYSNLELIRKQPHRFQVKTFSVDGVRLEFFNRCRVLLRQKVSESITSESFIETVRPLVTFYGALPEYARKTERLETPAIHLRSVIASAKDPEKTFFEDYPTALGFPELADQESVSEEQLDAYVSQLQASVSELQGAFDALVDRIENGLFDILGLSNVSFPDYKDDIATRYVSLRVHMLTPKLKTLHMRLSSPLEERTAWLESIVQVVLGKNIRSMRDEDERIVYEKLHEAIQALDNLCELDALEIDPEKETPAVSIQITSSTQGSTKVINRLPKQKEQKANSLSKKLRKGLSDDSSVNMAALTKLLQEVINNE